MKRSATNEASTSPHFAVRTFRTFRNFALRALWLIRNHALQAFWVSRNLALQIFWFSRNFILRALWTSRNFTLKALWTSRNLGLNAWWASRNFALRVWWTSRNLALRTYWAIRNFKNKYLTITGWRALYRAHLAKFAIFRWLNRVVAPIIWSGYRVVFNLLRTFWRRGYELAPMSDLLSDESANSIVIEPTHAIEIPGPRFIGNYPIDLDGAEYAFVESPKLEVAEFSHAKVIGGTNFLISEHRVIHPDLYVPSRDVCPAETFNIATVKPHEDKINLYLTRKELIIERAASLLGQCTGNYAHWLTETLPKLIILDAVPEYEDLPLLVDGWIHPVFLDTLKLLNRHDRELIQIERWQPVFLESVIDVSPPAYIPPEYRAYVETGEIPETGSEVFPFSQRALNMLRDAAHAAVRDLPPAENGITGTRFYLRRAKDECGNPRGIQNIDPVEDIIAEHGFETIEPGRMSFTEQIKLFEKADLIIAPVGAALANTIFTKPGCKIIALAAYYEKANYYYFSNMMGVLGHHLYYVLGPQIEMGGHPFHKDYEIDLVALKKAMMQLCH